MSQTVLYLTLTSIYKPVETSKGAFEENTPEDTKNVSESPAADEEADNSKTPYNQNANPKSSDDEIKDSELALFDSTQKDSEFEDDKSNTFLKNNEKNDMKQTDVNNGNGVETSNSAKDQNQKDLDEKSSGAANSSSSSQSGKDSNHSTASKSNNSADAAKSSTSSKSSLNNTTQSGSDKNGSKNSTTSQEDKDESLKDGDSKNSNSQAANQTDHSDQNQADDEDLAAGKQNANLQTVEKDPGQTQAEAIADDGTIVQAKWNPGTFDEDTVVFQAKVKQTDPTVEKQVLANLQVEDADQYQAITYDLTFYRRGENAELEEIEPNGTVLVTFGFTQDIKHVDSIYHYPATKRLEKMNLEQVNNSADETEASQTKQTQSRIPAAPKDKPSSSNAPTSLDQEDSPKAFANSNEKASQASDASKDQDSNASNLESSQDSKPESNKTTSDSKPGSDTDSDLQSTNSPATMGDGTTGENSNSKSQPDSEQNTDIDPIDTKESEPNQAADSTKESKTNPDQTSSVKSTAKQADQTVTNPTDSSPVSTQAANEIRTSITAALKQSLQAKSVQTNNQIKDETENIQTSNSDTTESSVSKQFDVELTDLTSNPEIQVVQFETDSFSEYIAVVRKVLIYDFTQEVEAEDGSKIKVSWNKGTFETDDVIFKAKKVELTEEELRKVQKQLDQDKNYIFRNYDLTFYVQDEKTELQKVEPTQSVYVEIEFLENNEENGQLPVFHFKDDGKLEKLKKTKDYLESSNNDSTRFKTQSFSTYSIPLVLTNGNDTQTSLPVNYVSKYSDIKKGYFNILKNNLNVGDNTYWFNNKSTTEFDLNGFSIQGNKGIFKVCDNSTLTIINSKNYSENQNERINKAAVNQNQGAHADDHWLVYSDKRSTGTKNQSWTRTKVSNLPLLNSGSGTTIEVEGNSHLTVSDVGIVSWNDGTGITAKGGNIELTNTYVVQGKRGLDASEGAQVTISGGAIADHVGTDGNGLAEPGAGIKITGSETEVTLNNEVEIVRNISRNDNGQRDNGGGGINVNAGTLKVNSAYITANSNYVETGVDEKNNPIRVGWSTGGGIKGVGGAKIYLYSDAHITYNWADCSGGGISLSDENTILYMYGGEISYNIAQYNEGGGLSLQAEDSGQKIDGKATAVLLSGTIENNETRTTNEWGGGGIFVGNTANLLMPNGADITENTAAVYGGGMAGCSTGKIVVDDSVVVSNNTLEDNTYRWTTGEKPFDKKFSEKIKLQKSQAKDYFTCFFASIYAQFNGQDANWSGNNDGTILSNVNDGWITSQYCLGLTAGNLNAVGSHSLRIQNNYSMMNGGGILVNGYAVGGKVRHIYNSDLITVNGLKKVVDQSDPTVGIPGTAGFQFVLKYGDSDNSKIIASGTSKEDGTFSIPNSLVQTATAGTSTVQYYLFELNDGSDSSIEYDSTVYRLSIDVNTTEKDPIVVSYPDPEKPNQTVTITVVEHTTQITGVTVSKKVGDSYQPYSKISVLNTKLTDQELEDELKKYIENFTSRYLWTVQFDNQLATFTNKKQTKVDIEISKKWDDGNENHMQDQVVLALKRKVTKSDGSVSIETVKEFTFPNGTETPWSTKASDLPLKDPNGLTYEYFVEEVSNTNSLYSPGTVIVESSGPEEIVLSETQEQIVDTPIWVPVANIDGWDPKQNTGTSVILVSDDGHMVAAPSDSGDYRTEILNVNKVSIQDMNGKVYEGYLAKDIPDRAIFTARNQNNQGVFQAGNSDRYLARYQRNDTDSKLNFKGAKDIQEYQHTYLRYQILVAKDGTDFKDICYKNNGFDYNNQGSPVRGYVRTTIKQKIPAQTVTGKKWKISFTVPNSKNPTYNFDVLKKSSATGNPLSGAKFELRKDSENGAPIPFVQENSQYTYAPSATTTSTKELVSGEDGFIHVNSMPAGTYWLVETQAPDGYWQPTGENKKIQKIQLDESISGKTLVFEVTNVPFTYELPETGGIGTKIYTTAGTILLLTGTGLYGYKRRQQKKGGKTH